jgi:hypothetical protein
MARLTTTSIGGDVAATAAAAAAARGLLLLLLTSLVVRLMVAWWEAGGQQSARQASILEMTTVYTPRHSCSSARASPLDSCFAHACTTCRRADLSPCTLKNPSHPPNPCGHAISHPPPACAPTQTRARTHARTPTYLCEQVQEGICCWSCHIELQGVQQDALNTQQVTLEGEESRHTQIQ